MAYKLKPQGSYKFYAATDDSGNFTPTSTSTSSATFTFSNFSGTIANDPTTNASTIARFQSNFLQSVLGIYRDTSYRELTATQIWSDE